MYLGSSRDHRVDRIIYLLTERVELDFQKDALQTECGIKPPGLTSKERQRKRSAYCLSDSVAANNICDIDIKTVRCKSFTDPTVSYTVSLEQSTANGLTIMSCTCPDFATLRIICKHVFLVNRFKRITISKSFFKIHFKSTYATATTTAATTIFIITTTQP